MEEGPFVGGHVSSQDPAASPAMWFTPVGDLPSPMAVLTETLNGLSSSWSGYLWAGLGYTLATLPLVVFGVVAIYLSVLPGILLGATGTDEGVTLISIFGGLFFGVALFVAVLAVASGPLNASLYRAVYAHVAEGSPLTFGAAYTTWTTDLGKVVAVTALQLLATLIAAMFCYFPALIVAAALHLALPAVVFRGVGSMDALRGSILFFRKNPLHHAKVWGVGVLMLLVAANIPFIGGVLAMPMYAAYQARYFRSVLPR